MGFCTYDKRQPPNEVQNDVNVRREQTFIIFFFRAANGHLTEY